MYRRVSGGLPRCEIYYYTMKDRLINHLQSQPEIIVLDHNTRPNTGSGALYYPGTTTRATPKISHMPPFGSCQPIDSNKGLAALPSLPSSYQGVWVHLSGLIPYLYCPSSMIPRTNPSFSLAGSQCSKVMDQPIIG